MTYYVKKIIKIVSRILCNLSAYEILFLCIDKKKLAYFPIPKTGSTSIKKSLLGLEYSERDLYKVHEVAEKYLSNSPGNEYFRFAFVRNPFSRVVSSYKNKIKGVKHFESGTGLRVLHSIRLSNIFFKREMTFDNFIKSICTIPDRMIDPHVSTQSILLKNQKVDFIGKVERLNEDIDDIIKTNNFPKVEHLNKTSDEFEWMDFYTLDTAEKVYCRYKKDFDTWYPDAYENLIEYINKK